MFSSSHPYAARWLLSALVLGSGVFAGWPLYTQSTEMPDFERKIDSVEKWDEALDGLRKFVWEWHSASEGVGKDMRDRTIDDDQNEWVLAPPTVKRLNELREKVRTQMLYADHVGVKSTLGEASSLVEMEFYKARLLSAYWWAESAIAHHGKLLQPLLERAPEAQKQWLRTRIRETERGLVDTLNVAMNEKSPIRQVELVQLLKSMRSTAVATYNVQRMELINQQRNLPSEVSLKSRTRETPCPPSVAPVPGRKNPSLAAGNTAPNELYPALSMGHGVEGIIMLHVFISGAGCMERAEVAVSSGVDELDEAALLWAERANFVPGENDHKSVSGDFVFRMKFELKP